MENNELYQGLTALVVGGVKRARYETCLQQIGFETVYRAYDKKTFKKINGLVSRSDIAILVNACCSHHQHLLAKNACNKKGVPFIRIAGSAGPQSVMNYLIDNYSRIKPRLPK